MDEHWKKTVWGQFGAAIDMLENAIRACPGTVWEDRSQKPEFWYVAFHTLFFLISTCRNQKWVLCLPCLHLRSTKWTSGG